VQQDPAYLIRLVDIGDVPIEILNHLVVGVEVSPDIVKRVYIQELEVSELRGLENALNILPAFLAYLDDRSTPPQLQQNARQVFGNIQVSVSPLDLLRYL
jgi:hypothetical protein